ncbi:MAG TPA: DUF4239 domain-containing protein [Thermoanaerobaculia bacterium]|nr:DUF4239 domain-containing protein [Thermoanaerobaculia bacterium]
MSILIVVLGVAASVTGMVIVRRLIPAEKLSENNEFVGFTFSILGLIYGIYLAFTVIVVWQQYESAKEKVTTEVALLGAVWRSVERFPAADRDRIRRDLVAYARDVITSDYPKMERGLTHSGSEINDKIWTDFYNVTIDTSDARAAVFYEEALSRMNEFAIARRQRILSSNASLPLSMWVLLVVGAVGTITFTWFYGTHHLSIQVAATTFLSAVIIYSVILVGMLEYPFGSGLRVSPTPYLDILEIFESRLKAESSTQ